MPMTHEGNQRRRIGDGGKTRRVIGLTGGDQPGTHGGAGLDLTIRIGL